MDLAEGLGERIRQFRTTKVKLTQDALAIRMQTRGHSTMNDRRISEIELGKRDVTVGEAVSFARIFGIPISTLLGVPDFEP